MDEPTVLPQANEPLPTPAHEPMQVPANLPIAPATPEPMSVPPPVVPTPPVPQQAKKRASYGALISIILILLIVIVGAFYAWGQRIASERVVVPAATDTVNVEE